MVGQLGHGDTAAYRIPKPVEAMHGIPIKQVACGQMHTLAVTDNGLVLAWGDNTKGQLGLGNMESNAQTHPRFVITVEPPVATTSQKQSPLLSDQFSKISKVFKSNHYN